MGIIGIGNGAWARSPNASTRRSVCTFSRRCREATTAISGSQTGGALEARHGLSFVSQQQRMAKLREGVGSERFDERRTDQTHFHITSFFARHQSKGFCKFSEKRHISCRSVPYPPPELLRPTLHAIAHKYPRQWPVEQYFRPWWAVASFGRREVCLQPPPRWHPPAQQEPPSWPPPPLSLVIPAPRQPLPPLLHHRHRPRTTTYRPLPTSSKISPTARRHSNRTSADPSQLRRPASSSAAYRNRPSASRPSATAG